MCNKDVCSQGMVNRDPGNYAASGPSQPGVRAGRRTREDTFWATMAYADKGTGWKCSLDELISYCEHDAITEVLKMKANTEIPVILHDSEKKKNLLW